jgi:hypothetical protein
MVVVVVVAAAVAVVEAAAVFMLMIILAWKINPILTHTPLDSIYDASDLIFIKCIFRI